MFKAVALPVYALWSREMIRFYRQRSRVVGALGSPVMFWLLIGSGVGNSFSSGFNGNVNYLQYFFPGTLTLILLFTSIFSTISIIEDRREGFMQGVLVAPIPRGSLVLGKILGGSTLAVLQALIFLALAPFSGIHLSLTIILKTCGVLWIIAFGLTGLGFIIAWQLKSIQGFHAIMNLFLIPLWLLSGSLFSASGSSLWLKLAMNSNPLTYGTTALRMTLFDQKVISSHGPSFEWALGVTIAFGIIMWIGSIATASRRGSGDAG